MKKWWLLLLIPVILVVGFLVWALTGPNAMEEAEAALVSDSLIEVDDSQWIVFSPASSEPKSGLIIYPGGRVDPAAYAPIAREIATEGYQVVIVPMPLELAFLGADRGLEVIEAFPEVETWAIAGHSLGGAMAANLAAAQPGLFDGLILWAAYPGASDDLSSHNLLVSSIYGTNDGVATEDEVLAAGPRLPQNSRWFPIEGGNHSQFGWYGDQSGDNPAQISREEQQAQILQETLEVMAAISGDG